MAYIGTAPLAFTWLITPGLPTLTNTIGTAHGADTSVPAKCEKSRKYRDGSLAPLTGDYARPTAWPYRSRKPTETCHVPHRLEPGLGDRGLKIYRSASV
jgi:hypothetical protein